MTLPEHPRTVEGRVAALAALAHRRAHRPTRIDNEALHPGAPLYFYCLGCGHLADIKPDGYTDKDKKLCTECQALHDLGWLE
jgi:cation diffusion facilitator CzcD-associated flavoprotein CzcO